MLAQILPYDGTIALLSMTAWSLFAVLSGGVTAVGVLLTKPGTTGGLRLLAQGGAAAVGIYWVLIVVRSVPSNDSFVATVGAFLSIGSVWLTSQDSR